MVLPGFSGVVTGREVMLAGFEVFCTNATVIEYAERDEQIQTVGVSGFVSYQLEMVYERGPLPEQQGNVPPLTQSVYEQHRQAYRRLRVRPLSLLLEHRQGGLVEPEVASDQEMVAQTNFRRECDLPENLRL